MAEKKYIVSFEVSKRYQFEATSEKEMEEIFDYYAGEDGRHMHQSKYDDALVDKMKSGLAKEIKGTEDYVWESLQVADANNPDDYMEY